MVTGILNDLPGVSCVTPKGAFYAFPGVASLGMTDVEFCESLLHTERVALIPGSAFGASGAGFVRASYTASVPDIEEALRRIGRFVRQRQITARQSMVAIL